MCVPSINGGHCVADPGGGGHCEDVGTCNASNCAGCCAGNICAEGTQNVACGVAGVPCQDCNSDGGTCFDISAPDIRLADGGMTRACGYECGNTGPPPAIPPACHVYCTSATNCISM